MFKFLGRGESRDTFSERAYVFHASFPDYLTGIPGKFSEDFFLIFYFSHNIRGQYIPTNNDVKNDLDKNKCIVMQKKKIILFSSKNISKLGRATKQIQLGVSLDGFSLGLRTLEVIVFPGNYTCQIDSVFTHDFIKLRAHWITLPQAFNQTSRVYRFKKTTAHRKSVLLL